MIPFMSVSNWKKKMKQITFSFRKAVSGAATTKREEISKASRKKR